MPKPVKRNGENELNIQRQIAFASGIFQGDVTVRTLLESLAEGVVIIDKSGTILLVNSRAEQMFAYPEKELIGKSHAFLLPERFRKIHEEHQAHFFAEPKARPMGQILDLTGLRRDGSEFPVEISLGYIDTINGVLVLALVSDMTLRKQCEMRLRESEDLFHIQVEGVKDYAIFLLDTKGNVLNWNAGADRLTGHTEKEIIGKHFSCFYPEEERNAGTPEEELKIAAAEGRIACEGWRLRKDGSRFWADVIITALNDESGSLCGFSKVTSDITERKRAEESLRESENKFFKAYQAMPSVLVIASLADGRYKEVNEAFERLMGYRRDEVIGRSSRELNIWQNLEDRATVLRMLAEGKKVRDLEISFITKSGAMIAGLYSAEIITIGAEPYLLSLVNDNTVRKKAEEELRHSEERYRRLYNETPVMLHSIDHDGRLVSVSNYWLETLGYERSEVLGRISTEFYTAASRAYATEVVLPEFFRTGSCKEVPYQIVKKTGEILDILLSAIAERDSEGQVVRSLAVMVDVTARKRAEEEIERLNMSLAARAIELEDANQELEAFNYTVAHDLRQPLNVIGLNCQAINLLCGELLPEECKGYVQGSFEGTLRMSRLIEALLNFSRMAHAKLNRERVDLSSMAKEIAEELKGTEVARRVTFRIADGIWADGDPNLLRVVLANLLGNAWKYLATQEEGIIEFGATAIAGRQTCFVRDNGPGFNMADAAKLFAPFQRLPGAEECRGFGIGLATVERIIRRHGGRVWAEGDPGKGACFYFTLAANGVST